MKTLFIVFWFYNSDGFYVEDYCFLTSEYLEMVLHELSIFDIDYSMEKPSFQSRKIFIRSIISEDLVYILFDAEEESERTEDLADMFVIEDLPDMFVVEDLQNMFSDDNDDDNDDNYNDPNFDPDEQNGQNTLEGGTGQWAHE